MARPRRDWGGMERPLYALTSLKGVESAIAGLDALRTQMPRALVTLIRSATEEAAVKARHLAPRQTGGLRTSISTKYFDDGETGAVFVAPSVDAHGRKRGKNFPRWVEFGTRRMDARPYLLPASAWSFSRLMTEAPKLVARFVKQSEG